MTAITTSKPDLKPPEPLPRGELATYVQVFDDALDARFCARMVGMFEQLTNAQSRSGRGHFKHLEGSAWTELNISKVADITLERFFGEQTMAFLSRYNENLGLTLPIPFRPRLENLRIKRYLAAEDDQFQPHFDAMDYTSNRYLVFLWYLNDVVEGGETEFCDLGLRISARVGRLLMFPPYWMFQHAGLPPRSGDKFILSTYMLF